MNTTALIVVNVSDTMDKAEAIGRKRAPVA
jgi:hypothetical protein